MPDSYDRRHCIQIECPGGELSILIPDFKHVRVNPIQFFGLQRRVIKDAG